MIEDGLRGHPPLGTGGLSDVHAVVPVVQEVRETKVGDLGRQVVREEHVAGGQVAVDDVFRCQESHSAGDLEIVSVKARIAKLSLCYIYPWMSLNIYLMSPCSQKLQFLVFETVTKCTPLQTLSEHSLIVSQKSKLEC